MRILLWVKNIGDVLPQQTEDFNRVNVGCKHLFGNTLGKVSLEHPPPQVFGAVRGEGTLVPRNLWDDWEQIPFPLWRTLDYYIQKQKYAHGRLYREYSEGSVDIRDRNFDS